MKKEQKIKGILAKSRVTLEEINYINDLCHNGELDDSHQFYVECDEGADLRDIFEEATIISPHNHQVDLTAWVPETYKQMLEFKHKTEHTGKYYRWTSDLAFNLPYACYAKKEFDKELYEQIQKIAKSCKLKVRRKDYKYDIEKNDEDHYELDGFVEFDYDAIADYNKVI